MKITPIIALAGMLSASVASFSQAAELPDFSELIKDNAKTVVQIDSKTKYHTSSRRSPQRLNPQSPEDLLRYFFGEPYGGDDDFPVPERRGSAHGSGFFIDGDGYILTNAHVVKGGDDITVSTNEQKEYKAELVGIDETTDVALLKINKSGTPAAELGDSDKLEVGNWVLAIGSPFGFDYTATAGIVSAVSRSLPDGTYVPFIQTDAAVNPGNSGGPLFNLEGEVIGINSQIYSRTGAFNGLAFAIPINTAMTIAKQLKNKGFVSRGWLGVAIQNLDQELAKSFGMDTPKGALVSSVVEDSPAEEAGIKAGDIILTFHGKAIKKSSELPPIVGAIPVGEKVEAVILRDGKEKTVTVKIGELDEGDKVSRKNKGSKKTNKGLGVDNLTDKEKDSLNIKHGVVVTKVVRNSQAEKAGFHRGDIIIRIGNKPIKNIRDFVKTVKKLDKPTAVFVIRNGRKLFLPL